MTPSDCLPEDVLNRYALGALSDAEASAADTHLATCGACLSRLDGLSRQPDTFVAALRRPATPAVDQPPALARALAAVLGDQPPVPGLAEPGAGALLNGYRLLEEIGRGGMGCV